MSIKFFLFILIAAFPINLIAASSTEDLVKEIQFENQSDTTSLELEAFSEKKLAKLINRFSKGDNVFYVNLQGVIDEESQVGTFADLDGLKNGNKVSLGYNRVFFNKESLSKAVTHVLIKCSDSTKFKQRFNDSLKNYLACEARNKGEADKLLTEDDRTKFYQKVCKNEYEDSTKAPPTCKSYQDVADSIDYVKDITVPGISLHRVGIELSAGNSSYKWAEGESLAAVKDDKSSYAGEFLYGYINENYESYSIAYRYEDGWKASDAKEICTPLADGSTSLSCQSIALSEPKGTKSKILSFEWKTYFGSNDSKAIAIKLSRDLETDVTGLDVPIYLYQEKKSNGLQGGVRIGFLKNLGEVEESKSDSETQFSLFLNKAFSIK